MSDLINHGIGYKQRRPSRLRFFRKLWWYYLGAWEGDLDEDGRLR